MKQNIKFIYGKAGTGKTFYLCQQIIKIVSKNKTFIVCCPTHSAVKNIYRKCKEVYNSVSEKQFKTIHSYFKINYENDDVIGSNDFYDYIIIDEVCLIKRELFKKIIRTIPYKTKIILSGDVLQLSPIYLNDRGIPFKKLYKYEGTKTFLIEHDYNNVFSTSLIKHSKKVLLTENKRSNDKIINIINELFYNKNLNILKSIPYYKIIHYIQNGFTLIASRYDFLDNIYNNTLNGKIGVILTQHHEYFKVLIINVGDLFYSATETNELHNNDVVKFKYVDGVNYYFENIENGKIILYKNEMFLIPINFLTAHKSQGMTIKNVIICYNNLFDVSMLYTMCTRASENIVFYGSDDLTDYINKFNELIQYYNL